MQPKTMLILFIVGALIAALSLLPDPKVKERPIHPWRAFEIGGFVVAALAGTAALACHAYFHWKLDAQCLPLLGVAGVGSLVSIYGNRRWHTASM